MTYPQKPGIYLLINKINGKFYLGKTVNLKNRINQHRYESYLSFQGKTEQLIIRALQLYGWHNFDIQILEIFEEIHNDWLLELEAYYIEFFDSTNPEKGYNLQKQSFGYTGFKHSAETKQKLREHGLKRGCDHMRGLAELREVTKETRKKMSVSQKKRDFSELIKNNKLQAKPVKQIDPKTGQVIKIWESAFQAAKEISGKKTNSCLIGAVCSKKEHLDNGYIHRRHSALGFKWEYATKEELQTFPSPITN